MKREWRYRKHLIRLIGGLGGMPETYQVFGPASPSRGRGWISDHYTKDEAKRAINRLLTVAQRRNVF